MLKSIAGAAGAAGVSCDSESVSVLSCERRYEGDSNKTKDKQKNGKEKSGSKKKFYEDPPLIIAISLGGGIVLSTVGFFCCSCCESSKKEPLSLRGSSDIEEGNIEEE